jgi:hypothetical protein
MKPGTRQLAAFRYNANLEHDIEADHDDADRAHPAAQRADRDHPLEHRQWCGEDRATWTDAPSNSAHHSAMMTTAIIGPRR